jgi:hypothetical protein
MSVTNSQYAVKAVESADDAAAANESDSRGKRESELEGSLGSFSLVIQ